MKKITLLIALFASFIFEANGQAVNTYGFAASTGGTLDAMTGSTQLIGTGSDDGASAVTNIGFTFNYAGTNYTQFSANANGLVRLGATAVTTQYTNSAANANTATPVIMPYWDDLATGSAAGGGKVHYLLTGSAPNQRLIIEWFVTIPRNTTGAANARFQCILEETTNKIYFVYGNGMVADTSNSGASIGLATATAVYNTVTVSTNTNTTSTFVTNNTAGVAAGTVYTWTPPTPCAGTPIAGSITPALQNVCVGTTPASFAATGFSMGVTGITLQWEESNDNGVTDAWAPAVGGTGATTASYTPPAFSGTTIYYRLNVTCTNSALSAQTASVSVNPPTAPLTQASALNFTNTLYTSVTANWTNGNGSRRILVVSDNPAIVDPVNASGQPAITANSMYAGSGQQIVYDGTGTTANVYGLGCNATYYFKVFDYTRCGAGPYDFYYNVTSGTNAASVTTTTPASATLPVANDFTGFTGANLSTVFPGWYEGAIPTAALAVPSNSNPGNNASNWINSSALGVTTAKINLFTNTRNEWIISPKIALTGNSRMLYRAAITDFASGSADPVKMAGTDDKVQIMISTDGCGANWTPIFTFDASNTAALTNVLTDYTLDLTAYTGQTVQIAFRGTDGPVDDTADYDFHITNINIELIPSCSTPTALGANNITANAASLFWTAGATEAAWNIEWGPTGFTQGTGTTVNGVTNPHPLSGLTSNTTYQYYVQADCAANGTSTWAGPFSFTTACDPITTLPHAEGFDAVANPGCWSTALLTGATNWAPDDTSDGVPAPRTGARFAGKTWAGNDDALLISPPYNLAAYAAQTVQLNVWIYRSANGLSTDRVTFYANNATNLTGATQLLDIPLPISAAPTVASAGWYNYTVNIPLSFNTSGVFYVIARGRTTSSLSSYSVGFDDYVLELGPVCPVPTALGVNNVTDTSASLLWTAGGAETAWNIEWGPTGFTQGTGTVVNGVTNPHPLSGLTASTTYQYYVQADCTTNGTSIWAGPFSFTTSCIAATVPYTQDFESATVPNLPSCTSQVNAGTGNLWTVENNPGYGFTTKALRYRWNTTNAANVWFFTQGVNLTAGQQYKISYNYGNAGASFPEKLKVAYGTSNTPAAMVTTLADYTNINQATIQNDLIVFTPATDGVYYFGFQAYSAANQFYLIVDNIVVDVNLGTSAFDASSFKAYPNPVTNVLNLSYSSEIASVEVFNMLGQKVLVKELNVAQGQIDMSGLNSGNYLVKVTADGQTKTIKVIKQ